MEISMEICISDALRWHVEPSIFKNVWDMPLAGLAALALARTLCEKNP